MQHLSAMVARRRVFAGLLVAVLVVTLASPTPASMITGACVSVVGEMIRVWASGYLRKNQVLAMGGPYAFTRNPLYLGNLFVGLGVGIAADRWYLVAAFILYYVVFYAATIQSEAVMLRGLFGGEFDRYRASVPALFPRFRRRHATGSSQAPGFATELVWRNREYRAATAALLTYGLLLLRMYWP